MIYSARKWAFAREYTHLFNSRVVCWYIVSMLLSTSIPYIFILDKLFVACAPCQNLLRFLLESCLFKLLIIILIGFTVTRV